VSLSGKLGFVPIDEVLRLLTRSKQQGAVDVTGEGLRGRVFVGKGGIDLATTWGDADLHRHLLNSGFSDEASLRRITSAETTLAAIAESNQEMIDLIREMTVESLYQIGHRGEEFRVQEGMTTPYASPKSFELENLLEDTKDREREWEKVSEIVPNLAGAIRFRRDLGDREEVTVRVDDWKVLSEIGLGASVAEIAEHLGTTDFWTARVAARLVSNDLITLSGISEEETPATSPVSEWDTEPEVAADEPTDAYEEIREEPVAEIPSEEPVEAFSTEEPSEADSSEWAEEPEPVPAAEVVSPSASDESTDPNESWWQEPVDEPAAADDDEARVPEVVAEGLSEIPSVDSHVEEDTEAFLEKVFSELESSEPEAEEGHGLLRRRRMGSLRDFSSDS
jgi:hypothetical protein